MKNKIELIDKAKVIEEIEKKKSPFKRDIEDGYYPTYLCALMDFEDFINTLEVKEIDLEKELDLEKEFDEYCENLYVIDIQEAPFTEMYDCAKYFFELGRRAKGEIYVVTRSEEHSDYVEAAFLNEDKAEEYCKVYNEDENSYHRNITEVKIQ